MIRLTLLWIATVVVIAPGSIIAQDQERLTARELFYGVRPSKKPLPVLPGDSPVQGPKAAAPPRVAEGVKPGPRAKEALPPAHTAPKQKSTAAVVPAPNGKSENAAPINVDYAPLGLRYSVMKRTTEGRFTETDVNTIFRSGDGIRVSIEPNDDAHLYIVNRGSSGAWSLLFPSPEINGGQNRVRAHERVVIPAVEQFTFVDVPGEERLFIVLSRAPEADLEQLIASLNSPTQPKDVAAGSISEDLVDSLRRRTGARDLIFEKISGESAQHSEQAVYVVNEDGSVSSRVVADLSLQHR